ncbi:MAG TPA: hypothetical protein VLT84_07655 [Acidobacteriota bacterium]|nr:hypothetical protein [Acidobacteriota bacterium]
MRDEGPSRARAAAARLLTLAAIASLVVAATPASSQTLRGFAQVQYELQDKRVEVVRDTEWWLRTVRLDYGTRIRNRYDITAQGEWNELSYVGRADRRVNPRGSLRLAHRDFGAFASYRPQRTTDELGTTTRQRETTVTAYLSREGLPRLQANYVRRFQFRRELTPEQTGTQVSLNASHQVGPFQVRGSWFRLTRVTELVGRSRTTQTDWTGGGQWTLVRARSSAQISYDAQISRRAPERGATEGTDVHSLSANASRSFSRRLGGSLTYSYRHSELANGLDRSLNDHEGATVLTYRPTAAVTASGGGGVRTARIEDRLETERYALASLGAQGRIRERWTGSTSLTRSINWLPGEGARWVDAASAATRMVLRPGLEVTGQAQVTSGRAPSAVADTSGRRVRVTAQSSAGVLATPLRPVSIRYSWTEYRTGESLFDPDATARSHIWDARWNPVRAAQFSGTLSRSRGLGRGEPSRTTKQATAQWQPNASLQISGTYVWSESARLDPITQSLLGREVFGLRVLAAPLRDWRVQASLNDVDPGRATHVRQWDLSLTRNFGR